MLKSLGFVLAAAVLLAGAAMADEPKAPVTSGSGAASQEAPEKAAAQSDAPAQASPPADTKDNAEKPESTAEKVKRPTEKKRRSEKSVAAFWFILPGK